MSGVDRHVTITSNIRNSLAEMKAAIAKASKVNGWYLHKFDSTTGGKTTVRGPWHRWFTISEGCDKTFTHISTPEDDAEFLCAAVNNFSWLVEENEDLKQALDWALTMYEKESTQTDYKGLSSQVGGLRKRYNLEKVTNEIVP